MERADNRYYFFPHVENVNFSPKTGIFFPVYIFFMRCKFSSIKLNKVYKLLWSHFRLFCCDIQYLVIIVGASTSPTVSSRFLL